MMMMKLMVNNYNDNYNRKESNVEFNFRFIMLHLSTYGEIKFDIYIRIPIKNIYVYICFALNSVSVTNDFWRAPSYLILHEKSSIKRRCFKSLEKSSARELANVGESEKSDECPFYLWKILRYHVRSGGSRCQVPSTTQVTLVAHVGVLANDTIDQGNCRIGKYKDTRKENRE